MKLSDEALALYQRRDNVIRDKYNELNKLQQYSQSQIYHMLSEQFFLLERQLYRIVNGKWPPFFELVMMTKTHEKFAVPLHRFSELTSLRLAVYYEKFKSGSPM